MWGVNTPGELRATADELRRIRAVASSAWKIIVLFSFSLFRSLPYESLTA